MTHLDEQGMYGKYTPTAVVTSTSPALPSSPVSDLVEALMEWSKPDTGSHDAGVQLVCSEAATALTTLSTRNAELEREVKRFREALTPSGETKSAYMGEFYQMVEMDNPEFEDDEDAPETIMVPVQVTWTTIKEIMTAIAALASTSPQGGEHE